MKEDLTKKVIFKLFSLLILLSAATFMLSSCEEEELIVPEPEMVGAAGDCGWCGSYPICCAGNADPDGDGWGWQWSRSCIVNNSGPANQHCGGGNGGGGGSCNGYPYCASSSSDPDGDGWGWENNQSCIVRNSGADSCNGGGGGGGGSSGSCPSSVSCPSGMSCGCYTVSGLGSNKQSYRNAGANRSFIASAMMETERMTTNYTYGDGKTGDAFNAGACKQNWGMIRTCHSPWSNLGSGSYNTAAAMNSNKSLDVQVYNECRNYYGSNWWAGHRNGSSGLNNPNTPDIQNFKNGYNWTYNNIANHLSDNVRFWVNIPAI